MRTTLYQIIQFENATLETKYREVSGEIELIGVYYKGQDVTALYEERGLLLEIITEIENENKAINLFAINH